MHRIISIYLLMNLKNESNIQKKRINIRFPFTAEEDQKLLGIVSNLVKAQPKKFKKNDLNIYNSDELINWAKVARQMGNRSVRQCKERYFHYLAPSINKKEWSNEEDSLLMSSVLKYGKKWKVFEELFSNRTEIDIRNRYYVLQRKISKIIRSANVKKTLNELDQQNIVLNLKQDYLDDLGSTNIYNNLSKNNHKSQLEQNDTDESLESPSVNLDDNYKYNNENQIPKIEVIDEFFKGISDISLDESQITISQKSLLTLYNGCVYDCVFVNDSTFTQ